MADTPKNILLPTVDTERKNINPRIILGTTKENIINSFQKNLGVLSKLKPSASLGFKIGPIPMSGH